MTKLQAISEYITFLPALKIGYVGQKDDAVLAMIDAGLKEVDGEIKAFIYEEKPEELSTLSLTQMPDYSKSFRTVAREYELLIINKVCHNVENQERLIKNAFKALENSGDLIVLESNTDGLKEILEACGFVAFNTIEVDDCQAPILSAKKMHGWGHGL